MTLAQMPHATFPTPGLSESDGTPLTWPPTGRQIADKPAGGFFQCPTDFLTLPWCLYRDGHLQFLALRTWYGLMELPERRCDCTPDKDVHYSIDELCQLLHVPRRAPVLAALRTLEDLGLVTWSASAIQYLPEPAALQHRDLPGYQALQAQIPAWRTWVPAPRRLLRWLAREGTPGLCATAAGVLLRCLWSKGRQCVSGGRVAATWIAAGFGLAERTVQRAMESLQACGWLARLPSTNAADASYERQHGGRTVVNLAWDVPWALGPTGTDETPPPEVPCRQKSQPARQEEPVENSKILDQNLSPIPPPFDQNLSPIPSTTLPKTPEKYSGYGMLSGIDLYPLQEQTPDPVPASRAPEVPTGLCHNDQEREKELNLPQTPLLPILVSLNDSLSQDEHPSAQAVEAPLITPLPTPSSPASPVSLVDPAAAFAVLPPAVQDELFHAATVRLLARGLPAALLIRPAVLAEVYAQMALPSLVATDDAARRAAVVVAPVSAPSRQAPHAPVRLAPFADPAAAFAALPQTEQDEMLAAVTARLLAQGMRKDLLIRPLLLVEVYAQMAPPSPQATPGGERRETPPPVPSRSVSPAKMSAASTSPRLSDVVPADLRDITRLEALRQQAIRRGWLTGCDADRLNFVAAAVHARRIGAKPCALFVAVVREQRWELITQEDEDQARALLRERDFDPAREAVASRLGLSEDARFVRGVQQILHQAGWQDDPSLAFVQRYPGWTRARWDAALAELHVSSGGQTMELPGGGGLRLP